jgi:ATP-binding cassette subfamily F protein uup
VRQGTNLQVAYFDQMRDALDLDATLEDFISPGSEWIEIGKPAQARQELPGRLPVLARAPTRRCARSRRRAQPAAAGAPVRAARQRAGAGRADQRPRHRHAGTARDLLQDYDGTVFLVSHDRAFLDNVVTSTIAFEGDGRWREYEGGVQDWLIQSLAAGR